ncbi:hypothetical protein RND81_02G087400 [Saponaria officinalis]|uniref:Uncharacterized protein n=1 Tax=Saponaria officinalis TaxID=3572 RepID=A0AAW1MRF9_SAPOF
MVMVSKFITKRIVVLKRCVKFIVIIIFTLEDKGGFKETGRDGVGMGIIWTILTNVKVIAMVSSIVMGDICVAYVRNLFGAFNPVGNGLRSHLKWFRENINSWVVILNDSPKVDISMNFVTIRIFDPGGNDTPLIGETWHTKWVLGEAVMIGTMLKLQLHSWLEGDKNHYNDIIFVFDPGGSFTSSFYLFTPSYEARCDP